MVRADIKETGKGGFQEEVVQLFQYHHWKVAHFHTIHMTRANGSKVWMTPAAADGKGFPDLVVVKNRVVYIELKVRSNKLGEEQEMWRDTLEGADAEWYCFWPKDWQRIVLLAASLERAQKK